MRGISGPGSLSHAQQTQNQGLGKEEEKKPGPKENKKKTEEKERKKILTEHAYSLTHSPTNSLILTSLKKRRE